MPTTKVCAICQSHSETIRKAKTLMREFSAHADFHKAARKIGLDEKAKWHSHVIESPACRDRIIDDYFGSM